VVKKPMYVIINGGIELKRQLSENFQALEFACSHCGQLKISMELINKLQEFRNWVGKPIHINSGYRCSLHSVEIGSKRTSEHCLGNAADIRIDSTMNMYQMFTKLITIFPRVGMYHTHDGRGFIHVDTKKDQLFWINDRVNGTGKYIYFRTIPKLEEGIANTKTNWKALVM